MMINIIYKMIKIMNRMIDDKYDENDDKDAMTQTITVTG